LALRTFEFIGDFNAFAAGLLLGILIMSALITLCLPTTFMRAYLSLSSFKWSQPPLD